MPEESATLPNYPKLSIHADHREMCKFSDEKDGNYRKIAEVLERWAKELKEEVKVEDEKPVCSSPNLHGFEADLDTSPQRSQANQPLEITNRGNSLGCTSRAGRRTLVGPGYVVLAATELVKATELVY